ncbi:MAG: GDSL-type esterase/lipase family protein [Puniceicoccales bacterium]|nr:GDSL-type esterase/lipase family protein [Puniceicoccales bacterium]
MQLKPRQLLTKHPCRTRFSVVSALSAGVLFLFAAVAAHAANVPEPVPKDNPGWQFAFRQNNNLAKEGGYDVLFLGDTLTHAWTFPAGGAPIWEAQLAPLKAVNFGISSDRIENVLYRIQNGHLDGKGDPKVIVLAIGAMENNNPYGGVPPATVAAGIKAIIQEIKSRKPAVKIILMAIFPRGKTATDLRRKKNDEINALITVFADNKTVFFKNINESLLNKNGSQRDDIFYEDGLYLRQSGYKIWADAIIPDIKKHLPDPK